LFVSEPELATPLTGPSLVLTTVTAPLVGLSTSMVNETESPAVTEKLPVNVCLV
jgi:hypothetical protein